MVGIFADDGFQAPVGQEIVFAFTQMKRDVRSALGPVDFLYRKVAFTGRFPSDAFAGWQPCTTGFNSNFIRDDKA